MFAAYAFLAVWVLSGLAGSVYWFMFSNVIGDPLWIVTISTLVGIVCGLGAGPIFLIYAYSEWKYDRDFWNKYGR